MEEDHSNCNGHSSSPLEDYQVLLVTVAILVLAYMVLSLGVVVLRFVFVHFVSSVLPSSLKDYGEWAVITGGNSGIGRSYAFHIAKRGMSVIIIGREMSTLRSTAEEIQSKYKTPCHYIQADLTKGEDVFKRIAEALKGKNVGILINNAGFSGKMPGRFLSETEMNVLTMINLHINAVVHMTRIVLQTMLDKGSGAIISISSFSSLNPIPRLNIYSSSKAFTDRFTRSISSEYAGKGLHIQSLIPGYVSTRMIKHKSIKFFIPSSDTYVKCAERTIGISDYTTGYWIHEVLRYFLPCIPFRYWKYFILQSIFRVAKLFFKI